MRDEAATKADVLPGGNQLHESKFEMEPIPTIVLEAASLPIELCETSGSFAAGRYTVTVIL
jgi:hypothetical protein